MSRARYSIVLGLLWAMCGASVANAQTPSPRDALVVTTDWLKQHSGEKDLVLLHVGEKKEYAAGHIPRARLLDVDVFTPHGGSSTELMLELPTSEMLHRNLESIGISDTSRMVIYFASDDFPAATRVIFMLNAAGLGNRASLLDGGMRAWKRGGNAITKDVPVVTQSRLAPLTMQASVDAAFVQKNLHAPGYKVIDARAPIFYDGVYAGMGNLKGRLPGATNIPFTSVTATDLTLKPADELTAIFKTAGVVQGDHVIVYCHIGLQGTAVVFAARSLGMDAVLYDGSFQDWARRKLPVENPAAKAR